LEEKWYKWQPDARRRETEPAVEVQPCPDGHDVGFFSEYHREYHTGWLRIYGTVYCKTCRRMYEVLRKKPVDVGLGRRL
jgi:hypothetical protein